MGDQMGQSDNERGLPCASSAISTSIDVAAVFARLDDANILVAFQRADADGGGSLCFSEFSEMMQHMHMQRQQQRLTEAEIVAIFEASAVGREITFNQFLIAKRKVIKSKDPSSFSAVTNS